MFAVLMIIAALSVAGVGTGDSHQSALVSASTIALLVAYGSLTYSDYYVPTIACVFFFIVSFGAPHPLAPVRVTVLLSGALAGGAYFAMSMWWRSRVRALPRRPGYDSHLRKLRSELFEVGNRYLAAWGMLLIAALVAALFPRTGLIESQRLLQDAGGLVVMIDLVAIVPGRFNRARRELKALARHPRPAPTP